VQNYEKRLLIRDVSADLSVRTDVSSHSMDCQKKFTLVGFN